MRKAGYQAANKPLASCSSKSRSSALRVSQKGASRLSATSKLLAIDKSTEAYQLTYYDPPTWLERYILVLFEARFFSERVEGVHPAALGVLQLTVRGRVSVNFGEREDVAEECPILFNAFEVATPYRAEGPIWCLGASLTPYGWAALTQASLKEYGNRVIHANTLLGNEVDRLNDDLAYMRLSNESSAEECCLKLANWIGQRLSPIPAAHEEVIDRTLAWLGSSLNPSMEELFQDSDYSRRQDERIVQRYFGFAPKGLSRKFRAIRAANLLAQTTLSDEAEAEIACAFVDQSHMIREIRRFCGYTPACLGDASDQLFLRLTNMQNLDRFRPYRPIGKGEKT